MQTMFETLPLIPAVVWLYRLHAVPAPTRLDEDQLQLLGQGWHVLPVDEDVGEVLEADLLAVRADDVVHVCLPLAVA